MLNNNVPSDLDNTFTLLPSESTHNTRNYKLYNFNFRLYKAHKLILTSRKQF